MGKRRKEQGELDARLVEVFCRVFGEQHRATLTPATSMDDIAEWDSTTFLDFVFAIEEAYGVSFTPDESAQMFQLGHIQKIVESAVLDIPHKDVANACCLAQLIRSAPADEPRMVVLSGSSTREGLVPTREAEQMLRTEWLPDARWYNISVSGLVAAETLQWLEVIGGGWKGLIVVGASPIILAGCGTAEFARSANHDRFPFSAPVMEAILKKNGYEPAATGAAPLVPLELWVQRYLKDRALEDLHYNPYIYPTLAPWPPEKYLVLDDVLRFYNQSILNYEQSLRINAHLFEAMADWRDRTGIPLVFAELTLHSTTIEHLERLGGIVTKYRAFMSDLTTRREIPHIDPPAAAGVTDHDFRDPAHLHQRREAHTRALITGALRAANLHKAEACSSSV